MMQHEKMDVDILADVKHIVTTLYEDWKAGRAPSPTLTIDILRTAWQQYRAVQLLQWLSDNIEEIKGERQGGLIEKRVPDRLPQDSSLWTQESL